LSAGPGGAQITRKSVQARSGTLTPDRQVFLKNHSFVQSAALSRPGPRQMLLIDR
jgi:hypothetical protein